MANLIIGPMLRHVGETSATIWVETDAPCAVEILGTSTPTFTVEGHHYALVIVEHLQPASSTTYDVRLDGRLQWPLSGSSLPRSRIRTLGGDEPLKIVFGSCRTAAPHEPPWSLELAADERGRGVDALYAHALRMVEADPSAWPHLAVFLGDQVYADDASPQTWERVRDRRARTQSAEDALPADHVNGFEEYCWLYHESWSPDVERWFFSVVPSVMIFDDHDMIDDWNISAAWLAWVRRQPWWDEHYRAGLMTYWIYQHLGNLDPRTIRDEGMLAALIDAGDGSELLRAWAVRTADCAGVGSAYRFSYARDLGATRLVMIDTRHDRVLEPGHRRVLHDDEWSWVAAQCRRPVEHLVIGSSLAVFVPSGIHDLQVWDEAVADGRWGRWFSGIAERVRRGLDLEDWPAFSRSFDAFVELLRDVGGRQEGNAPRTITVLSGDIHFSYLARVTFLSDVTVRSSVHQLVNSPIRNALRPKERRAMKLAMSPLGGLVGRLLRRSVHRQPPGVRWEMQQGPIFDNCLGLLVFDGPHARVVQEQARPGDDVPACLVQVYEADLLATGRDRGPAV